MHISKTKIGGELRDYYMHVYLQDLANTRVHARAHTATAPHIYTASALVHTQCCTQARVVYHCSTHIPVTDEIHVNPVAELRNERCCNGAIDMLLRRIWSQRCLEVHGSYFIYFRKSEGAHVSIKMINGGDSLSEAGHSLTLWCCGPNYNGGA